MQLPESGVGYQIVDIGLKDGRVLKKQIVLNCEILELSNKFEDINIKDVREIKIAK